MDRAAQADRARPRACRGCFQPRHLPPSEHSVLLKMITAIQVRRYSVPGHTIHDAVRDSRSCNNIITAHPSALAPRPPRQLMMPSELPGAAMPRQRLRSIPTESGIQRLGISIQGQWLWGRARRIRGELCPARRVGRSLLCLSPLREGRHVWGCVEPLEEKHDGGCLLGQGRS